MLSVQKVIVYEAPGGLSNDRAIKIKIHDNILVTLKDNKIYYEGNLTEISDIYFAIKENDTNRVILINYEDVDYIKLNQNIDK